LEKRKLIRKKKGGNGAPDDERRGHYQKKKLEEIRKKLVGNVTLTQRGVRDSTRKRKVGINAAKTVSGKEGQV